MPNWTSNTIRAEGRKDDLRAFLEAVKWQDQIFDFNRIIPMPALLRHTAMGRAIIDGKEARAWYVIKPAEKIGDVEQIRLFTPEEEAALRDIGYSNWYDWSIANWGTKWNACHALILDLRLDDGYVEIAFDTAWAAPLPVLRKMFELFAKLSFVCTWQDEGEDEVHSIAHRSHSGGRP